MTKPQLFIEPWDVRARLANLCDGLDEQIFLSAGREGFSAMAECTENHPLGAAGYYLWSETTKGLRDRLATFGWRRSNDQGFSLTVNQKRNIAISVSSGDEYTGKSTTPEGYPQTKYAKGPRTIRAVEDNALYLPGMEPLPRSESTTGSPTWLFLIRADLQEQTFVSELSLPTDVSKTGFINGWRERIILSTFSMGGGSRRRNPDEDSPVPQTPIINVEIKKIA